MKKVRIRTMNKRHMILCLGPNRTGTSAATAAIAALGADLGFVAVYANEENQKGFFEHPKLVEINEKILSALDGSWDSAAFVGRDALALANDRLVPLRSEALGFLRDSFSSATPALLKDPRLCLLLEFWLPVFKEAGFGKIDIVHILRDPAEAALSQQVRTIRRPEYYEVGRNLAEGAALWLAYMAQMWDRFADSRHLLLSYDDLVDRPQDSLKRLGKFLALTPDAAQLGSFLDTFLDTGLRHSKPSQDLRAEVDAALPAAREVYDLLTPLCASGLLTPAIVGSVQSLALTAKPAVERLQSGVVARLSNAKRGFGSQHARLADQFAVAQTTATDLRRVMEKQKEDFDTDRAQFILEHEAQRKGVEDEFAHVIAEHAKQRQDVEADRAQLILDYEAQRKGVADEFASVIAKQRQDLEADRAQLILEHEAQRKGVEDEFACVIAEHEKQRQEVEADRAQLSLAYDVQREAVADEFASVIAEHAKQRQDVEADRAQLILDYEAQRKGVADEFASVIAEHEKQRQEVEADRAQLILDYEAQRKGVADEFASVIAEHEKQRQEVEADRAQLSLAYDVQRKGVEDEFARVIAEHAKQRQDVEADRAQLILDYEAQRKGVADEFASVIAEHEKQRQEVEADRDRIVEEYRAERQAIDIEIAKILEEHKHWTAALLAENDRIVAAQSALDQLIVELGKAKSDLEVVAKADQIQAATAHAQLAHELLLIERDMQTVRQAEAETAAKLIAIKRSRSWKITAPLRAVGLLLRQIRPTASGFWMWVNHASRRVYRSLDRRSPWLAEQMRRMAVPVMRMGNRVVFRSDYVPTVQKISESIADHVEFQFDYQLPQVADENPPLVTVLVPNYNHAPYLRQRLDSIFAQTWTNFEVILMDDCSTDESREILEEYAARYSDRTRTVFNTENSGGAFCQWEKGLRAAKGDLIWVAESDDWCSTNLLETLVPFFANPAVQLAYAPSYFMNQDGTQQVWSMAEYLSELGPERWSRPFVMTAPQIVREAFAEKNIIPNASSAVFRRHDRLEAMEIEVWRGMRTCGDWVFYLNQIRGGLLAYSPDAQNYYRQHPNNTSVTSFSKDSYYIEHETAAKTVQRHYSVEPNIFQRQYQRLVLHWTRHRTGFAQDAFDTCYSLARIQNEAEKRKPKLLMAGYGFISGGGETFPIMLANVMKTAGYDVTFLNCMQEPDIKGIRDQLARDIPVVTRFEHLTTILADFDIDIVHSHHGWVDNTILNLLPEDSPTKTVVTLHGMYETMAEVQLKRILPRLVKRSGALVYTAMKNISALVSRGLVSPDDLPRIDNALAYCDINPVDRATLGIAPEAFVLVMVARAIPTKGWAEAIEAVGRARKLSGHDIHLVIVGDGPEHDRLAGTVAGYIHLEGFRSNMRDYFAMGDMGFLPSCFKGESFPLVLIDCLQSGKPLIASDVGEVTYMLQSPSGPAGVTFALKDWQIPVDALAKQIAALAQDPELLKTLTERVAEAARKFDPQLMRDRYDAVYEGLVQPYAERQAAE
jgi:glycosyltransferase involved in cell wall biosynthesis